MYKREENKHLNWEFQIRNYQWKEAFKSLIVRDAVKHIFIIANQVFQGIDSPGKLSINQGSFLTAQGELVQELLKHHDLSSVKQLANVMTQTNNKLVPTMELYFIVKALESNNNIYRDASNKSTLKESLDILYDSVTNGNFEGCTKAYQNKILEKAESYYEQGCQLLGVGSQPDSVDYPV